VSSATTKHHRRIGERGFATDDAACGYQHQRTDRKRERDRGRERCAATKALAAVTQAAGQPTPPSRRHRHVDRIARSFHFIFPRFSPRARRFVPSDKFAELLAHPGPECICQRVKQIGRQLTNTSASRSPLRTRRPRKLPLTNVLFIPRHGSCTPHSTNFITRVSLRSSSVRSPARSALRIFLRKNVISIRD